MILYYQVSSTGNYVKIYKQVHEKKCFREEDFVKKAKIFSKNKIKDKIPYPYNTVILSAVNRVVGINNMKLSPFGVKIDECSGQKMYFVGNCEFDDLKPALVHGEVIYGKEFMEENMDKLEGNKLYYYRDNEIILDSLYFKLIAEKNELLKIQSVKIVKEDQPTPKKR